MIFLADFRQIRL